MYLELSITVYFLPAVCRLTLFNPGIFLHQSHSFKVDISKVSTLCALLESLIFQDHGPPDPKMDSVRLHPLICTVFVFCYAWAIGGNLVESSIDIFDSQIREMFQDNNDVRVSSFYSEVKAI